MSNGNLNALIGYEKSRIENLGPWGALGDIGNQCEVTDK
jgi:hypothetical protein